MADYKVQINVKVGDHLINIQGDSPTEAYDYLKKISDWAPEIHQMIEKLDGRTATQIVQKEKSWGARSQGGRTYPQKAAQAALAAVVDTRSAGELIEQELSGTEVVAPAPQEGVSTCEMHGQVRTLAPGGVSQKTGKEYSSSLRCPAPGCRPLWQKKDGSFA